jgi:hypothetical protein
MIEQHNDILISRILDGNATSGDWDELTALADANPALWRNLAMSLREHQAFARAVNADVAIADAIEMPLVSTVATRPPHNAGRHPAILARVGGWSGWAVAAVFTIVWVAGVLNLVQNTTSQPNGSAPVQTLALGGASASELLQAYLDKGRQEDFVIAEVPQRVLIETRPNGTGHGYELIYLRQILERTVVPDLYQFNHDESGQPTLVRYDGENGPSM